MKHDELRGVAHNVADSFASGIGLPISNYVTDVFSEARKADLRSITVDFLKGAVTSGSASASLIEASGRYRQAFAEICAKHGIPTSSFRVLHATYHANGRVSVKLEDNRGRCSMDEYAGLPLRHPKIADSLGRVRTLRNPKRE